MEFRILGPLEVIRDGEPVPVRAGKQRVLLASLLLRANQVVSAAELIDRLWGDTPGARARDTVYQYVRRLRQSLGSPEVIRTAPGGYLIVVQPDCLDAQRFDDLVTRGRELAGEGDLVGESTVIGEALSLWRGPALADVPSDSLRQIEGARLAEQRSRAIERRLEIDLLLGRHDEMIGELTRLTREHPLRERLWHQLIVALYRCGRQAEALESYQTIRRLLHDELGVDPGNDLQELHRAILSGEVEPIPRAAACDVLGSPAPVAPSQLPSDIGDFVGRAEHVAALRRMLRPGEGVAVVVSAIAGKAGIGKTALAVHAAHQLRESFPDGQLYANLRGAGPQPAQPADVLARFLHDLGIDGALVPADLEQRAALYRSVLDGRHILVVLDDAADEAQVVPLLPGSSACGVLVTSRMRLTGLAGAHRIELDVLESGQAIKLLANIAGAQRLQAEPEHAEELVRLCGRLPLALRIAGARLAAKPHWTLGVLVARLADERRRLTELVHGALEVRASLELSYVGLDTVAQLMFRRLGLLDVPDFAAWAGAAVTAMSEDDATDVVERLVDAQLLDVVVGRDELGQARYCFHDLVRVYARERADADESPQDRTGVVLPAPWLVRNVTDLPSIGSYVTLRTPTP